MQTQFEKAKTQFENGKSPIYYKVYIIQWNLKAPKWQNSIEIIKKLKDLRYFYTKTTLKP